MFYVYRLNARWVIIPVYSHTILFYWKIATAPADRIGNIVNNNNVMSSRIDHNVPNEKSSIYEGKELPFLS